MLAAADAGADDVTRGGIELRGDLRRRRTCTRCAAALEAAGIAVTDAEATMLPKTTVAIEDEATAKKILKLIDSLEENDDVQDVYANFDIPERSCSKRSPV